MERVTATAVEIKYYSGAMMRSDEFAECKTFISDKGVIKTTFKRNMKYSDDYGHSNNSMLPIVESYEYRLENNLTKSIFEQFKLIELKPIEGDMGADDGGGWQIIIYTNGVNITLKGYEPPEPFGEELADKIRGLIKYKINPMIF